MIENYLGFPDGITGEKLLKESEKQAKKFGVEILEEGVLDISKEKNLFTLKTTSKKFSSKFILLAIGNNIKNANIYGEKEYSGKGVHYCVPCDGYAYKDKKVIVVGNKDFAANEALEMLDYTKDVTLYTNGLKVGISKSLNKKLEKNNIKIVTERIKEITGKKFVDSITTNKQEVKTDAVFVALGHASVSDFAARLGIKINDKLITVNEKQETNVSGLFAAGDCTNSYKQIGIAVGDGIKAAFNIIKSKKN